MTDEERYHNACHAMQTGVAHEMNLRPEPTFPKHLRVGVNIAMRDFGSLVKLLVDKGLITEEEFGKYLADGMEEEVRDYEARLKELLGGQTEIKLH